MNTIITISEKDIFYYVFCKWRLTGAQISFIKQHNIFIKEIKFYLELKKSFHKKIDEGIRLRLHRTISGII